MIDPYYFLWRILPLNKAKSRFQTGDENPSMVASHPTTQAFQDLRGEGGRGLNVTERRCEHRADTQLVRAFTRSLQPTGRLLARAATHRSAWRNNRATLEALELFPPATPPRTLNFWDDDSLSIFEKPMEASRLRMFRPHKFHPVAVLALQNRVLHPLIKGRRDESQ